MSTGWDNVQRLAQEFPTEPIRLNDFARLLGLDESGAAQLRAARRPPTGSEPSFQKPFPETIAENGRTFAHRLGDLVDWIRDTSWLELGRGRRRLDELDSDQSSREAEVWRLTQLLRTQADAIGRGVERARRAIAELVVTGSTDRLPPDVADAILQSLERPRVVEQLLTEFGSAQLGTQNRTSPEIAFLTAVALDPPAGASVHDPTCGECEVLVQTARLAKSWGQQLGLVSGDDKDANALQIGAARLKLAGVEASMGSQPPADSVDCLVIDPGWDVPPQLFMSSLRSLRRDGRVALISRVRGREIDLIYTLPPSKIVFPPQRPTKEGAVVIWLSFPLQDPPSSCDVIDFRRETTRPGITRKSDWRDERLEYLNEALRPHRPVRTTDDRQWNESLEALMPSRPATDRVSFDALPSLLGDLVGGGLGFDPEVIEANRAYAVRLVEEITRLIDPQRNLFTPDATIERPEKSPDGVLAGLTTTEAKRVIERLLNSLSSEKPRGRPR
jgi:hypothetical protein